MAVSANEIWQQMTRIGIVDVETAKLLHGKFRAAASKSAAAGDESKLLAQFLILKNVVTRYQAKHLLAGRAAELRLGDFLVVDRCDQTPLTRWVVARKLASSTTRLLYACDDDLASDRWVDPAWLSAHDAVETPGLQPLNTITLVASDPWRGIVCSAMTTGRSLAALAADGQRWSPVKTAQIAQRLGEALSAMHSAQLIHGQVRPSRIWQTDDGAVLLLRDGGRPAPTTGSEFEEHRWLDDDQRAQEYLPPEYIGHDVDASPACDIYALGATLFELYTGQPLRAVERPDRLPVVVQTARDLGAAGDPLLRTIAYAIDPDPQGRFADIESFARALAAVFDALGGEQAVALENMPAVNDQSGELLAEPIRSSPSKTTEADDSDRLDPAPPPIQETRNHETPIQEARPAAPPVTDSEKTSRAKSTDKNEKPRPSKLSAADASQPAAKATVAPSESSSKIASTAASVSSVPPVVETPSLQSGESLPRKVVTQTNVTAASGSSPTAVSAVPGHVQVSASSVAAAPTAAVGTPVVSVSPSAPASSNPAALPGATASPQTANGDSGAPPRRVRKKAKRTQAGPIIVGSVAVAILLAIMSFFISPSQEVAEQKPRPPLPPPPVKSVSNAVPNTTNSGMTRNASSGEESSSDAAKQSYQLVNDDRLLWAPPWQPDTKSAPLEMIPPGSQAILSIRLGHLLSVAEKELHDWLNPDLDGMLRTLSERCGVQPSAIDRLTIALNTTSTGHPRATFTIKLKSPQPLKTLSDAWKVSASRTKEGKTIYSGDTPDGDVYYTPTTEGDCDHFVFGPLELISGVAEVDGNPITMARSLQQLWDTTSVDADVVGFAIPNFLFADGREYTEKFAPRAATTLRDVFIPDTSGLILTMALESQWYGEFRVAPSSSLPGPSIVQKFDSQIQGLPTWAESFVVDANIDPSWRLMAIRLPQYMRALATQMRSGMSDDLPTFNFYLPRNAAPQMLVATTLALSTSDAAPAVVATTKPVAKVMTTEQLLDHPFSVSFEQEALKSAVVVILDEFKRALPEGTPPPAITILGGDLEKSGITQNQQIRNFTMRDRPLREALSELCRQANPDKTATSLSDPKQSLIWIIDPEATEAKPSILITTRPIATEKGQKLTKEFTGQ